jgi:glyoxylase-like metal-dependent hydrolase (beta-lactamase superfamily II)
MGSALRIGDIEIHWLQGGEFELDGGTMFGVVPKVLWEKMYPTTEGNYIHMLNAPLLVKTPDALVVVETGLGDKLGEQQKRIYRVGPNWNMPWDLESLGFSREDVTHVVLTHCDFDHAGGIVMTGEGGTPELTFPKAQHIVQRAEWEDVLHPNIRTEDTYLPENFTEIKNSPLLNQIEGEHEVVPGVRVAWSGGHTRGHQVVWMESGGECAVHMADLLPTHVHFNPRWVMAYDNFPMEAIAKKEDIEREALKKNAWFTFYHDPFMAACRFGKRGEVLERFEV